MSFTRSAASRLVQPWQRRRSVQLLAAVTGVLPLYSSLVVHQLRRGQPLSLQGLVFYLAVIAPLAVVIALVLLRFLCGEHPRSLNLRPGKLSSDFLGALILAAVIIVANVVSNFLLPQLLPDAVSGTSVRDLFVAAAGNPGLFVLFVGPLVFLGAASEELIRVFLLSRLWKVWLSTAGKLFAVVISAVWFGLIHVYRGPVHVAWAGIFGLIVALHYARFGRVVPLILAHYVTNAIQMVGVVVLAR